MPIRARDVTAQHDLVSVAAHGQRDVRDPELRRRGRHERRERVGLHELDELVAIALLVRRRDVHGGLVTVPVA